VCKLTHQRKYTDENQTSTEDNGTDDKLTLGYMLDTFQGTLTPKGLNFIATTNHEEVLDPALIRKGRMDVKFQMRKSNRYQINSIYKKFIGRDVPTALLNRIKEDTYTPAEVIFHVKDYYMEPDMSDEEILAPFLQ